MSVLRATSFKSALGFTLVMTGVLALVLGLLYGRIEARLMAGEEARIWREAASLDRIYAQGGLKALAEAVSAQSEAGQGLALHLSNRLGVFLTGNILRLPTPETAVTREADWFDFERGPQRFRARLIAPDADLILLIGFDRRPMETALADMRRLFIITIIGLSLLGLLGALALAARSLARVGQINTRLAPVMKGELSTRLPETGKGDEWALMAAHINTMLAQLERLVDATREVSDNLAHDLRAPLTRLKMRLEALSEGASEAQLDQLDDALGDVDALLRSFNALLTLSRLESGTAQISRQKLDMTLLMADMQDLFEAVFEARHMQLDVTAPPSLGFHADASLLSQAIANGLENILTHGARADTTARLELVEEADAVLVKLSDEGPGIAAQDRARAQERFVRLDESRSGDGTGLGLSLIAAICRHHGGTLELADTTPDAVDGNGLKLVMRLPKIN